MAINIKRPLVPKFLQRAEQKLLLKKPGIWSTRAHLVLYYSILLIIGLAIVSFLEPVDIRSRSTSDYWIMFVSMISIIGVIVWLIYLLRFNLFKKYGILHSLYPLTSFLLYFISAGIIVLFTYVHPAVESVKANMAFGDEELVNDINSINLKVGQLEYERLRFAWNYDTVSLITGDQSAEPETYEAYEAPPDYVAREPRHRYVRVDSSDFKNRLFHADSTIKLDDTIYVIYTTPDYAFVSSYRADLNTKQKMLSSFEVYNKVIKAPPAPNREAIGKELAVLLHKYHYEENLRSHTRGYEIGENDGPLTIASKKYHLYHVSDNFSNIVQKKYRWYGENLLDFFRVFYYVTLGISLLVFIFRNTSVRTFFLSILTGVLLTILTGLILSFTDETGITFFSLMIAYTLLFFLGSLAIFSAVKRSVVTGIMTNLFVFIIPVFPLVMLGWFYALEMAKSYEKRSAFIVENMELYIRYAEIGGALLMLVLMAVYFNKVYRRWYALPQE